MAPTFIVQIQTAITEVFSGGPVAWASKVLTGIAIAIIQSVEASLVAIAMFLVLCILDAVLGVMRVYKRNKLPNTVNTPIKPWFLISGPASKWFVGGIVMLAASFFDNVMFGHEALLGGPLLKFSTGVVLGAIILEVAGKADYLQGWGLTDKLRKRFPEFFPSQEA
jgi:hypothetical protein